MANRPIQWLRAPLDDYVRALRRCLGEPDARKVVVIGLSLLASWWLYVPIHELLHVLGCVMAGGEVTRLEIDAVYAGALLARLFPFVSVGSDYAGQLTGFDTKGSDFIYLVTDFLPFVLTIGVGIPLLRYVARTDRSPLFACVLLGGSIPLAFAPFISVTGDYYEMGSIVISRVIAWGLPGVDAARWRSDDMFGLVYESFWLTDSGSTLDAVGIGFSFVAGLVLIAVTYLLGVLCSRMIWGEGIASREPASPFSD